MRTCPYTPPHKWSGRLIVYCTWVVAGRLPHQLFQPAGIFFFKANGSLHLGWQPEVAPLSLALLQTTTVGVPLCCKYAQWAWDDPANVCVCIDRRASSWAWEIGIWTTSCWMWAAARWCTSTSTWHSTRACSCACPRSSLSASPTSCRSRPSPLHSSTCAVVPHHIVPTQVQSMAKARPIRLCGYGGACSSAWRTFRSLVCCWH